MICNEDKPSPPIYTQNIGWKWNIICMCEPAAHCLKSQETRGLGWGRGGGRGYLWQGKQRQGQKVGNLSAAKSKKLNQNNKRRKGKQQNW